jgi:hypothetical protein
MNDDKDGIDAQASSDSRIVLRNHHLLYRNKPIAIYDENIRQ